MHLLRCSPCHSNPLLLEFDGILREGLEALTNSRISDVQWIQASLPIKDGGLGFRRVSQLALSAFLASAAGTSELHSLILSQSHGTDVVDLAVEVACSAWISLHSIPAPSGATSHVQRAWDAPSIAKDKALVMSSASSNLDKARLLAISANHSSDWLYALPISACGLRLDDEAIRIAVGLRLGLELCQVHTCPCGHTVDTRGTHGLSCRQSVGRTARHQQLNDFVYRAIRRADVPAVKEPSGLFRSDGKRPDGLTLVPWQSGRCLTWDVTVADTLAPSYSSTSSSTTGAVAEAAATRKSAKYATIMSTHLFVPFAVETMGPIGNEATEFLTALGKRLTARSDDPRESMFLFQRLSVLIQRYNAVAFRGSFVDNEATDT